MSFVYIFSNLCCILSLKYSTIIIKFTYIANKIRNYLVKSFLVLYKYNSKWIDFIVHECVITGTIMPYNVFTYKCNSVANLYALQLWDYNNIVIGMKIYLCYRIQHTYLTFIFQYSICILGYSLHSLFLFTIFIQN